MHASDKRSTPSGLLSAEEIRDLIIDRLVRGVYPLGAKLPTTRELAAELGAHRNTVARAYQFLAQMNLVSGTQGRGTYVVGLVEGENRQQLSMRMSGEIRELMAKARRLGIAEDALRRMLDDEIKEAYGTGLKRAAYIECNHGDVESGIHEIETAIGARLSPVLLDQFEKDVQRISQEYDILVTSLIHVNAVTSALDPAVPSPQVIGVHTQPDERALEQIAQLPENARIGLVVESAEGAQRFKNVINTFANANATALIAPSSAEIQRLAETVDVIVCSRSRQAQVEKLQLPIPTIALAFHLSLSSVAKLMDSLV